MRTARTIRTCPVRMKFTCPRTWEGLRATEPPFRTPDEERANALSLREHGITDALDNLRFEGARDCPECGYPVPSFRESCYVCGFKLGRG